MGIGNQLKIFSHQKYGSRENISLKFQMTLERLQHFLINVAAVGAAHHARGGGGRHADVAQSEAVVETDVIDVCAGGAAANGEGQVGVGDGDDGDVKED